MIWKGIVGRNFTPDAFREYVAGLTWGEWQPEFITLHHTAVPSLAQRPNGFNNASMSGLERYYRDEMGWSAGPHLFVDDQPAGIWVFTPSPRRGYTPRASTVGPWVWRCWETMTWRILTRAGGRWSGTMPWLP